MTISIRRARPFDYEAVGEITVRAYTEGGFARPDSVYVGTLADARARAEQAELWVAVRDEDGEVLGSVTYASPGSGFSELAAPGEGELRMLAAAPAAQGQGVGEALVRHCVDRARGLGVAALVLSTQPTMTAAHRIYERTGFVRTPAKDWEPIPGVALLAYRLDLHPTG
jgi:ribosomal protein S18 acetylase RimI-like enzyme